MNRRSFLKFSGSVAAYSAISHLFLDQIFIENAFAEPVSINSLRQAISPSEGQVLTSADQDFSLYQAAYNKRTILTPTVRVLCKSVDAVIKALDWAQQNQVPLATRCGGHSYEGFSQSKGLVIDTRFMSDINFDSSNESVTVGGGTSLGSIYVDIGSRKYAMAAGSCPTVGISGHTLGGGYGLLSRAFGLACDNITEFEIVTADRKLLTVNANQYQDLNWALRGGGGGSFGVITKMKIKTHKVETVIVFGCSWNMNLAHAMQIIKLWQNTAPTLPQEITSLLRVSKDSAGNFNIRLVGQSTGSESNINKFIKQFYSIAEPSKYNLKPMTFLDAFQHFAGSGSTTVFMKAKSDYLKKPMSDQGLQVFLQQMPLGLAAICDSYGGQIAKLSDSSTAFAHRQNTICSIQYYRQWERASDSDKHISVMRSYYDQLRPFVSGGAYVNYCDLDLKNYSQSYWGDNYTRLVEIKQKYDPRNIFNHAQSIKP